MGDELARSADLGSRPDSLFGHTQLQFVRELHSATTNADRTRGHGGRRIDRLCERMEARKPPRGMVCSGSTCLIVIRLPVPSGGSCAAEGLHNRTLSETANASCQSGLEAASTLATHIERG